MSPWKISGLVLLCISSNAMQRALFVDGLVVNVRTLSIKKLRIDPWSIEAPS